jgi:hypothetical protein
MAGQPRLGLAKHGAKIGHAERTPGTQRKQAKTGRLGGGAKLGQQVFHER